MIELVQVDVAVLRAVRAEGEAFAHGCLVQGPTREAMAAQLDELIGTVAESERVERALDDVWPDRPEVCEVEWPPARATVGYFDDAPLVVADKMRIEWGA